MNAPQQPPPPQPNFRTVCKAQIPLKTLTKLNEKLRANQQVIARIYELMEHASIQQHVVQEQIVDEAARVLKGVELNGVKTEFKSRHELRTLIRAHKFGLEIDDETGEVRIYEQEAPPAPTAESVADVAREMAGFPPAAPPLKLVEKPKVQVCSVCSDPVEWSQSHQKFIHSGNTATGAIHDHDAKMITKEV